VGVGVGVGEKQVLLQQQRQGGKKEENNREGGGPPRFPLFLTRSPPHY